MSGQSWPTCRATITPSKELNRLTPLKFRNHKNPIHHTTTTITTTMIITIEMWLNRSTADENPLHFPITKERCALHEKNQQTKTTLITHTILPFPRVPNAWPHGLCECLCPPSVGRVPQTLIHPLIGRWTEASTGDEEMLPAMHYLWPTIYWFLLSSSANYWTEHIKNTICALTHEYWHENENSPNKQHSFTDQTNH